MTVVHRKQHITRYVKLNIIELGFLNDSKRFKKSQNHWRLSWRVHDGLHRHLTIAYKSSWRHHRVTDITIASWTAATCSVGPTQNQFLGRSCGGAKFATTVPPGQNTVRQTGDLLKNSLRLALGSGRVKITQCFRESSMWGIWRGCCAGQMTKRSIMRNYLINILFLSEWDCQTTGYDHPAINPIPPHRGEYSKPTTHTLHHITPS